MTELLLRREPEELKGIAANEYKRRGSPLHKCCWPPSTMVRYMRWKFATMSDANQDIGVYAHEVQSGNPAPLPERLLAWEKASGLKESIGQAASGNDAAPAVEPGDMYNPEDEFQLVYQFDGTNTLVHVPSGDALLLNELPNKAKYKFYQSEENIHVVWTGGSDAEAEYCFEIFRQAAKPAPPKPDGPTAAFEKKSGKIAVEKTTRGTSLLPGMKVGSGKVWQGHFAHSRLTVLSVVLRSAPPPQVPPPKTASLPAASRGMPVWTLPFVLIVGLFPIDLLNPGRE